MATTDCIESMQLTTLRFIKASLRYNAETGNIHWIVGITNVGVNSGDIAGRKSERYHRVKILNKEYPAHTIAWYLHTGEWRLGELDHINRDGFNNRLTNLRVVNRSENQYNRNQKAGATAPLPGIRFKSGKWEVNVGKEYLGRVGSLLDAAAMRISKLNTMGISL